MNEDEKAKTDLMRYKSIIYEVDRDRESSCG